MKKILVISLLFMVCQPALSQQAASNSGWDSLKFLLGKWVGEGTSEVGEGSGYFTFEASLNGKALVRKNRAEYPATKDRPKVVHEVLMVVYLDSATKQPRAFYTDSEGNVINYTVSSNGKTVVFLSDAQTVGPRYRLTYILTQPEKMSLTFEVAPPDKPDQFKQFIEGKVRKVSSAS